jgi:hypothetical protein
LFDSFRFGGKLVIQRLVVRGFARGRHSSLNFPVKGFTILGLLVTAMFSSFLVAAERILGAQRTYRK